MNIYTTTGKTTKLFNDEVNAIINLETQIKALKAQQDIHKSKVHNSIEAMETPKSVSTDNYTVTYKGSTTSTKVDTKRFKSEALETYKKFIKTSPVKSSISVKAK